MSAICWNVSESATSISGESSLRKDLKLLLIAELITSPSTCSPLNRFSSLNVPLPTEIFMLKSLMRAFSTPFSSKYLSTRIVHAPTKRDEIVIWGIEMDKYNIHSYYMYCKNETVIYHFLNFEDSLFFLLLGLENISAIYNK